LAPIYPKGAQKNYGFETQFQCVTFRFWVFFVAILVENQLESTTGLSIAQRGIILFCSPLANHCRFFPWSNRKPHNKAWFLLSQQKKHKVFELFDEEEQSLLILNNLMLNPIGEKSMCCKNICNIYWHKPCIPKG
jgi:hypothetical protein